MTLGVTAPLTALGVLSFKAASDAAELESAFKQTFGSMSDEVGKWAVKTGDAMGRSTQEIQKAANTFGIFFNQAAPTKQAAADLSKSFTVLAQDLSSFFNTSPDEALQKLRSGLSGESEPLRDFGVFLNEAAVGQKALEMGLAKTTKELTDQNKIMARAALIMESTKNAQGDVARTSDGTANRVRAAKAAFEELTVAVGQKLIPALTPLIQKITDLLNGFNNLSPGMQSAIVGGLALAAALGPVFFVVGQIIGVFGPFIAGIKLATSTAAAAGVATSGFKVALVAVKAALLTAGTALLPWIAALGVLAGIYYIVKSRSDEVTTATEKYTKAQAEANAKSEQAKEVLGQMATANAKLRAEIIARAKADRQAAIQAREKAKADLLALRAETARLRAFRDAGRKSIGSTDPRFASLMPSAGANRAVNQNNRNEESLTATIKAQDSEIASLTAAINSNAAPPSVSVPKVDKTGSSRTKGGGASGPSAADIEQRFRDELAGYADQALSAMAQLAMSADERAEYELRSVELARVRTLEQIKLDGEYSKTQKDRLVQQVEALAELERQTIERNRLASLERESADMAQVEFDRDREMLALAGDMADTQAERKRIALEILTLEQQYRRQQLEMVTASAVATDAEKKRAQAILDSLAAIEAGETASASRANETDVERYMRDLNKSPEQINEAIDSIKIGGLEALSDGLVDAIVNFKSLADVARQVVRQVLSELMRLAIQQAIIKPLAAAMGFPGFAKGTNFAPGGMAIVGEKGPELVNLPRGSQVIPNHELAGMGGRGGQPITFNLYGVNGERQGREAASQIAMRMRHSLNAA